MSADTTACTYPYRKPIHGGDPTEALHAMQWGTACTQ
jgi:hypothetical protein